MLTKTKTAILTLTIVLALCFPGLGARSTITVVATDIQAALGTQKVFEQLVEQFEASNPDTKVDFQTRGWTGYLEYLVAAYASGIMPDVFQMGYRHYGPLQSAGALLPLNDYIDRWGQSKDYPPFFWQDVSNDGTVYAIPYRADIRLLMYNPMHFARAGLPDQTPPRTWDDLLSSAKKLTRTTDGNMAVAGYNLYRNLAFIWQAGGDFVTPVGNKYAVSLDSAAALEALDFHRALIYEHNVTPAPGMRPHGGTGFALEHDTVAMEMRPEDHIRVLRDVHQTPLGIGNPLSFVESAEVAYLNKWGIASGTKNPDACWRWLELVSNPEALAALGWAGGGLPPRRSVARLDPWRRDPHYLRVFAVMDHVRPTPASRTARSQEILQVAEAMFDDVARNKISTTEAISRAVLQMRNHLRDIDSYAEK